MTLELMNKSPFLRNLTSLFDIFPRSQKSNHNNTKKNDAEAIADDWEKVGYDFWEAIQSCMKETPKSNHKKLSDKETFVKVVKLIEAHEKIENEFGKVLKKIANGHSVSNLAENLREAIKLLMDGELYEWVEWYLYERDPKDRKVKVDGKSIDVSSPGKLYDFIKKPKQSQ